MKSPTVGDLLAIGGLLGFALAASTFAAPATPAATGTSEVRYLETPAGSKPRVLITADPELDDLNSLIRYVLMSDGYRTEGLIYASSQFHWTGDGTGRTQDVPGREYNRNGLKLCPCTRWRWSPQERFIDDVVDAYAAAYPNLKAHSRGYMSPARLRARVKWGNVQFDGDISRDTEGSDFIKALLLENSREPIYLHAWGGLSTIGRALKSIEEQYADTPQWDAIRAKVIAKAIIHASGDQDDVGRNYIKPRWPQIRYGIGGGASAGLSYGAQTNAHPDDKVLFAADWMQRNIRSKGIFGRLQRVWGDGKQMVSGDRFDYFGEVGKTRAQLEAAGYIVWTEPKPAGEFLGEGDTATFLSLLDNGLAGWRQENRRNPDTYQTAGAANIVPFGTLPPGTMRPAVGPPSEPARFLRPLMHDLAERMTWAVTPRYRDANHYPFVRLVEARLSARPGETVALRVRTSDPDGDSVHVKWWRFEDSGTYSGAGPVKPTRNAGTQTSVVVPTDARPGDTLHIIAEATDEANLALTRYARAVITVR